MIITVGCREQYLPQVQAYLYRGQSIVGEPRRGDLNIFYVLVDTGDDDSFRADYLRDRLASGLYSARTWKTREEAEEYLAHCGVAQE